MEKQIIVHGEEETRNFAKEFAKTLTKREVIVLTGNLGTGKTKFTEGVLSYFGAENQISSPTFTIVNEYETETMPIYHFDVYRLEDEEEFYAMGGDEYFGKGLCIIEWGELIQDALPPAYIHITIEKVELDGEEETRIITINRKEIEA